MTDTTSPQGTVDSAPASPMTFEAGVNAIAGLLGDDPETDNVQTEVAASEPAEGSSEPTDDDLALDDVELDDVAETPADAPPAITDDYEIALEDGQKISLAELKRNNLFQRDYTRKTMELAEQKKALEADHHKRVSDAENEIRQQRQFILDYASRFMPQKPSRELLQSDPVGYMEAQAAYEEQIGQLTAIHQQTQQETAAQQKQREEQEQQFAAQEWDTFITKVPALKTPEKLEAFRKEVRDIGIGEYGLTMEELPQIKDSRYLRILHDAIKYQQLKAKAASVQKQVVAKPKLVQQQRMAPQTVQERDKQGRFEAHRKAGSINSAAAAIEKLL